MEGAERGVKLALIGKSLHPPVERALIKKSYLPAGIKEGLYDIETLASYLLYRLNILNPRCRPNHAISKKKYCR